MSELHQIEKAIAALEQQRALLGDAVVETALASMRAKLNDLKTQTSSSEAKRKQVTVLFADVSGFTAMSETLDAEVVTEIMNELWGRLDATITAHGGQIDKHIGDAVMALWGVEVVSEDDPESAIRAALDMQSALAGFHAAHEVQLAMRIGLNTGPVLLGEVGSTHEFTAMGDTVNLASRLEHAAPVDGILISHDTYRHVRGVFDVTPQSPMVIKGKTEPVQTYLVQRAKPRAFRMGTRGIEGMETRMVGRDAEFLALQNAYIHMLEKAETRFVVIIGEAGVGKSRLLYEFENWLELRPELVYLFKGRAIPAWQHTPYGIFRDLFASRFDILESDSASVARDKFCTEMAGILSPEQADLVGHWIGYDFSGSPSVHNLTGSSEFGKLAQAYLTNYVRTLAKSQPMVIFLEDLHWADASSLALLEHLIIAIPQARLLLVGLTRPTLFESHPLWGENQPAFARIELKLLPEAASQALVDEILQKVENLPQELRDLIIARAEGNPFYVEELVKMLLEEQVIIRGPDVQSPWHVNLARLAEVLLPPTLTGLLQARLDSLPQHERESLQRASVIGRLFWDAAVADLTESEQSQVALALDALCDRELIFDRRHSAFAGTEEYIFKHALLRDVTYETVLLKLRRSYHAQVARWLETHAGERIGEYAGLIAEHLESAGKKEQAAHYLLQAGKKALASYASQEAISFFKRVLALIPEESQEQAGLMIQIGWAYIWLGDYDEARRQLETALTIAQKMGDDGNCADALERLGCIAREQGDFLLARAHLEMSLKLARKIGDQNKIANALWGLGWIDIMEEAYVEGMARLDESQILFQALGDRFGQRGVLDSLGAAAKFLEEYTKANALYREVLMLSQEAGDRRGEAVAIGNLGEIARLQGDFKEAWEFYQKALDIFKEIGSKSGITIAMGNLGHLAFKLEDYAAATSFYRDALQMAKNMSALPIVLENLSGLAGVLACTGQPTCAIEWLGLALAHPALDSDARAIVEQNLALVRTHLPPDEIASGLERGKRLDMETVVEELLKEEEVRND